MQGRLASPRGHSTGFIVNSKANHGSSLGV
nr:MAG TPA: hypothetical protein [Caudoviricetes sp.]